MLKSVYQRAPHTVEYLTWITNVALHADPLLRQTECITTGYENNWIVAQRSTLKFSFQVLSFLWKSRSQSLENKCICTESMVLQVQCSQSQL